MKTKSTDDLVAGHTTTAPQDIARQGAASFEVYRQLRDDIVSCRLKPNERLRFDALRQTYGAGMGTLREALSHLVSDGLVRIEVGRGFSVAPVSVEDLVDVTEWRVEFEVRAATLSVKKGDEAWEAEIVAAFHLLRKSGVPDFDAPIEQWAQYSIKHKRFHDALTSACGSPWLMHFRSVLFEQARRYQSLSIIDPEQIVHRGDEEHQQLMDAALDRNEKAIAECIEQHIRGTTEIVRGELSKAGIIESISASDT